MSFKVNFIKKSSNRLAGIITVSCTITCTNWMFGDTVDIALYDCYGQNPWYYRDLKFKSGQSYTFDYDTVGWQWCQGDYIAIVDKNNKILQKWHLQIPEYRPGECPECHGTHKCRACNGEGYVYREVRYGNSNAARDVAAQEYARLATSRDVNKNSVAVLQVLNHFKYY